MWRTSTMAIAIGAVLATGVVGTQTLAEAETTAPVHGPRSHPDAMRLVDKDAFGPLAADVLARPQPVRGTDKLRHVVYEISLVNTAPIEQIVKRVKVIDPQTNRVLAKYATPKKVHRIMTASTTQGPGTDVLTPNGAGMLFLNLRLRPGAPVPSKLVHRVTTRIPGAGKFVMRGARTTISHAKPAHLVPPLVGDNYLNANGCCDKSPHTRAVLNINGVQWLAQRFAIDWVRIDRKDRMFHGTFRKNKNWVAFGDPVVSASGGVVVETLNKMSENKPPIPATNLTPKTALGNHVIVDIGNGRFALYAHLQPGSVTVRKGDAVEPGQLLGRVGNTGSSTAPHLHFHVTNGPSAVASNGVPYVFREFTYAHRVLNSEELNADEPARVAELGKAPGPKLRHRQLPMTGTLIDFPGSRRDY